MSGHHRAAAQLCAVILVVGGAWPSAQQTAPLPSEPPRQFGTSVTGAYEGWFDNPDGSHNLLVGYLNRNLKQNQDIPIGPNNRIEPGGPAQGQPTHFQAGRKTGVFIVTVPKTFPADQRLTWTLVINGQTTVIPLWLNPLYLVSPFADIAVGNTPPVIKLSESGPALQGPVATMAKAPVLTAALSAPLALSVWVDDDAKFSSGSNAPIRGERSPIELVWSKYRGPGAVTFDAATPKLEVLKGGAVDQPFSAVGTTTARFSTAGEYVLHVLAMDYSGEGGNGEVCCWTNGYVKVTVTP
jgi:hypothetical protein